MNYLKNNENLRQIHTTDDNRYIFVESYTTFLNVC